MEIRKELLEMRGKGKKEKPMTGAKGLGNNRMPLFELIFKRCRENINTMRRVGNEQERVAKETVNEIGKGGAFGWGGSVYCAWLGIPRGIHVRLSSMLLAIRPPGVKGGINRL